MEGSDYDQRKQMYDEIVKFNKTEQEELYRILRRCNEELSENKNGIFFNLMNLRQSTIEEIQKWILFCRNSKELLETREKEMSVLEEELENQ